MQFVDYVKSRLEFKVASEQFHEFQKATQNMADDKRNEVIDNHVMNFLHHLFHDIQDKAREHGAAHEEISGLDEKKSLASQKISNLKTKVSATLTKIIHEFAEFKISDPSRLPHIQHMLEKHPVIQQAIQKILKNQLTIEDATEEIIGNIDKETEEDRGDLSSSIYQKSSGSMFGMFGAYSFPSYPIAFSASSMSRFRPTPPFLRNTSVCPDEKFIDMLMKTKNGDKEEEIRPVVPADMSHDELSERSGLPNYRIPAETVEERLKNNSTAVSMIKARLNGNQPMRKLALQHDGYKSDYPFMRGQ